MQNNKPYIIGITGGSASGKTRLLQELLNGFNEREVCLISQDNYYKNIQEQPVDNNGVHNFDTPDSIDAAAFARDLKTVREGGIVKRKEYTYNNSQKEPSFLEFAPAPIIVVEGIFVFYHQNISEQLDLKIFIDAEEHIKLKRRIIRDSEERGYDLDDVLYRYEAHVYPTYEQYIAPFKNSADLVVPNNIDYKKGLKVINDHLQMVLKKSKE